MLMVRMSPQKTACVDFSFNPLCDRRFKFYDSSLVEAVELEDPAVQEFFRLLALCHTVMPEEKTEGKTQTHTGVVEVIKARGHSVY